MAEVISNRGEHDRRMEKAIKMALRLVGGQAERMAKETISDMEAVDTGFLRNSITFAIAGEKANIGEYFSDKGGKVGEYSGTAPDDTGSGEHSVYVGTNVYYAPYVEYGTYKMTARPFLSESIQKNQEAYKQLFKEAFDAFL